MSKTTDHVIDLQNSHKECYTCGKIIEPSIIDECVHLLPEKSLKDLFCSSECKAYGATMVETNKYYEDNILHFYGPYSDVNKSIESLMKGIITLSNGKKVANFSSPHDFTFVDNSILPKVSEEMSNHLKVTFIEDLDESNGDVTLTFELSAQVNKEMSKWKNIWFEKNVDVIFCPLPMITALHSSEYNVKNSPFRAIRREDRLSNYLSIEKQSL